MISLFLLSCLTFLHFFFLFLDCSFFIALCSYSVGAMYSIISLSILVWVCVRSFLLPAVSLSSNLFLFSIYSFWSLSFGLENLLRWLTVLVCQLFLRVRDKIADLEALRTYIELVDYELQYRMIRLEVCWKAHVNQYLWFFPLSC